MVSAQKGGHTEATQDKKPKFVTQALFPPYAFY